MPVKLSTFGLVAVLSAAVATELSQGKTRGSTITSSKTKRPGSTTSTRVNRPRLGRSTSANDPTAGTLAVAAYIDMDGEPRTEHLAVL